ncbi:MAG: M28 family peptidase [bacterium]
MKKKYLAVFILILSLQVSCSNSQVPEFDKNKAFNYLQKQCDTGYRYPGSKGHKECLDYLYTELKKYTDAVAKQPFPFTDPRTGKPYQLHNIIASFGKQSQRILLCAHWDTRPVADQDPNLENRDKPVLGANDGASGVAVLLEIARIMKQYPPPVGIDIVLFDGEDSGVDGRNDTWCYGSRYFAQHKRSDYLPQYGILLDMIGDKDLYIPVEGYSKQYVPELVDKVWSKAESLGLSVFDRSSEFHMVDDHLELIKVGIPCVNIIDFNYPYWHTVEDTPDKCSPESLDIVGKLVLHLIYE